MLSIKKFNCIKNATFICSTLSILFSFNVYAASNESYKEVNQKKVWHIKFNQKINFDKLSNDSVKVIDKNNNSISVKVMPGFLDNEILVMPPLNGYMSNENYNLIVTRAIYSTKNQSLKQEQNLNFRTNQIPEEIITFKDDMLDHSIRYELRKSDDKPIYRSELLNILKLKVFNSNIKDISEIQNLTNLSLLWLLNGEIDNLSYIKNLTNLEEIDLNQNKISDISPIKGLINLETIYLNQNKISDISSIKELINLKSIYLHKNNITDISVLKNLTNLKELDLGNNNITDISALKNLSNLTKLDLSNNNITDIVALKDLKKLKFLDLSNNNIKNINELKDSLPNCQIIN